MNALRLNVAVTIPTYNRACFLREAIESALSQNIPHIGVYVVDDASTDGTPQLMEKWYGAHPSVHSICLSENSGPAYARMVGVKAARTERIAFWTPMMCGYQTTLKKLPRSSQKISMFALSMLSATTSTKRPDHRNLVSS